MPDINITVSSIIGIINELKHIKEKVNDTKFQYLLSDLINEISTLKIEIAEFKEENSNLKNQLTNLQNIINMKNKLIYNSELHLYFSKKDKEQSIPFCPVCFDDKMKAIHLYKEIIHNKRFDTTEEFYICKACKNKYRI